MIINYILSLFDNRTDYQKEQDEIIYQKIRQITEKYPSFRISKWGAVSIDPKEIANSPEFKRDLQRARKLIERN